MFFRQIKQHGDNFSYVIADDASKEAAVVDPSFNADSITQLLKDQGFNAKYIVDTHSHMDHVAGNETIKKSFGAKIVAHKLTRIAKDMTVDDDNVIRVGSIGIRVIYTPGHTPDSICLFVDNKVLTGDTLFVGECGRTDLPGGSVRDMYNSLFEKLMKLDDSVEVYPGHDYGSSPHSTIGLERRTNYTLKKRTLEEFIEFMRTP
jgi:glyoxylase-like metal-dependent hydrolase (beta-lactamase superfamily II)